MRVLFTKTATVPTAGALAFAIILGPAGCGGGEPGLSRVRGRVTYKGEPVTKGDVYFSPEVPGKRGAHGTLDSDGSYSLGTFEPGDGAYAGRHRVSIVSRGPDKPIPAAKAGRMLPEDMQGTGDPLIPRKYFSAETSGLSREVVDGTSNVLDFDLKD